MVDVDNSLRPPAQFLYKRKTQCMINTGPHGLLLSKPGKLISSKTNLLATDGARNMFGQALLLYLRL